MIDLDGPTRTVDPPPRAQYTIQTLKPNIAGAQRYTQDQWHQNTRQEKSQPHKQTKILQSYYTTHQPLISFTSAFNAITPSRRGKTASP